MKYFCLWRGLMSQTKFSYLTLNNGPMGPPQQAEQVNICSPTWLQDGMVWSGRRAGGGG